MRHRIASLVWACLAVSHSMPSTLHAQVSQTEARQMGLEVAWTAQVQVPVSGRGIVSTHLWAEPTNPRKFAVVELPERTIRVAASMLDRKGQQIGIEEAKKLAQERAARFLGRNDGFQVVEVAVPNIKLVLITADGLVQNLDAESGKLLWAAPCGQTRAPAHPGAVSSVGVTLIHGERLYVLDWKTGKHILSKPLRYATANSVAVCNNIGFVSDFTGRVVAYGLGVTKKPWNYVMQGRAVGRTVSLANQRFAAIASDDGFVYVYAGGERPQVWIRYETNSSITGSLAAANNAFYVGTAGGLVSKFNVEQRIGTIAWEYRVGQTITAAPLVVGDQVLVASEAGNLVSIDDKTGIATWIDSGRGIVQPIAKADGKVFCLNRPGQLVAYDAQTGSLVGRTTPFRTGTPLLNQLNDRVYLISANGRVQCLRKVGAQLPTMITAVQTVEEEPQDDQGTPETAADPLSTGSPFDFNAGGGAAMGDPFSGAGAGDAPAGGDPFGNPVGGSDPLGGADPFGGSGSTDDPFGDDPFGSDK